MSTRLNRESLVRLYGSLQPAFRKDPLFARSAGGSLRELERLVKMAPATWESFFGETLTGIPEVFRYAALVLAARMFQGSKVKWTSAEPKLRANQTLFVPGDAVIKGHLVLPSYATVVVAGSLTVTGSVVATETLTYSLLAAGRALRAKHLFTAGEVLSGGPINVSGIAYLEGNDYSSVAPKLTAGVLIQDDREDHFLKVRASKRWSDSLDHEAVPKLQSWTGLQGVETPTEFEEALKERMLLRPGERPRKKVAPKKMSRKKLQEELSLAAQDGATSRVKDLLKRGADPMGDDGFSTFQNACYFGYVGVLRLLIEHGLDVNWTPRGDHWTGLMVAASRGQGPIIKELLASGADPNIASKEGSLALELATHNGHREAVKLLLDGGADPRKHVGPGPTAFQLARSKGHRGILALLSRARR